MGDSEAFTTLMLSDVTILLIKTLFIAPSNIGTYLIVGIFEVEKSS